MPIATSTMKAPNKGIIVKYRGEEYDVTEFLKDHPGGWDAIASHNGEDITEIFEDATSHKHSGAALKILKKFHVTNQTPKITTSKKQDKPFLDFSKPLVSQIWNMKMTKEEYLRQVHIPHHLKGSARFFESDFLERLTKTPWWFIPLFWGPISALSAYTGITNLPNLQTQDVVYMMFMGFCSWSIFEYCFHRFLFHMTDALPDNGVAFTFHFLFHAVHHLLPMDKYRLVMPPLMFATFSGSVLNILRLFFPINYLLVLFSGTLIGYICYDMMHYYFHHGKKSVGYIQKMKTWHMDHHYVDENAAFGVTSTLWDRVFNTMLPSKQA